MTNLGSLARRGLPLLRRAAQGAGHGHLPGARLRRARLSQRSLQPAGDDRIVGDRVDARDARPRDRARDIRRESARRLLPRATNSRRLTFCRQFIRAVFSWPTKQPLVKLTPLSSAALHSSQRRSPSSARPSETPRRSRCSSQPSAARPRGRASGGRVRAGAGREPRRRSRDQCTASPGRARSDRPPQPIDASAA